MRGFVIALVCLICGAGPAAADAVYPWLAAVPADSIADRFAPPAGFERVAAEPDGFGAWLRGLPLAPAGTPILQHDGGAASGQWMAAAVVDIDVGAADLQQCADSIIRLRAEYLFSRGALGDIAFDFTSGDRYGFSSYAEGVTPAVAGSKVSWRKGRRQGDGHDSLRRWLDIVFTYAGTISLDREMRPVGARAGAMAEATIGDALILPGAPGHAVLIVDMAVEPASGRKAVLLAQGFMPAQSLHILANAADLGLSPWFVLGGDRLAAPPWLFSADRLRRFWDRQTP